MIGHVKSNTIGDFTGTVTVFNSQGSTLTANATDVIRPSDWNSAHNITFGLIGNTNNSSQAAGTDIQFSGGNGVTLIGSGSTVGISVNTGYRASNDAVGLNSALTAGPLAMTINSAGISLNASSAAGTVSGFTGANISGSVTLNTSGMSISLSGLPQATMGWFQPEVWGNTLSSAHANGTAYLRPFLAEDYIDVNKVLFQQSMASSASTASFSASVSAGNASSGTGSWGQSGTLLMFSRLNTAPGNASFNSIQSFKSFTVSMSAGYSASVSWSTNASSATASWTTSAAVGFLQSINSTGGVTFGSTTASGSSTFSSTSTNANSFSSSYIMSFPYAHLSGVRPTIFPGDGNTIGPNDYWLGVIQSSASGSTNMSLQRNAAMTPGMLYFTGSTNPYAEIGNSVAITTSNQRLGFGSYSASSQTTTAIPLNQVSTMASNASLWFAMAGYPQP